MSIPEYKDGKFIAYWDFECPLCGKMWNNTGDPIGQDEQVDEECPGCGKELIITASYSVDYYIEPKEQEAKP